MDFSAFISKRDQRIEGTNYLLRTQLGVWGGGYNVQGRSYCSVPRRFAKDENNFCLFSTIPNLLLNHDQNLASCAAKTYKQG